MQPLSEGNVFQPAIRHELNEEAGISSTLINLGLALFNQGHFAEIKPYDQEAIEISPRINQSRNRSARAEVNEVVYS